MAKLTFVHNTNSQYCKCQKHGTHSTFVHSYTKNFCTSLIIIIHHTIKQTLKETTEMHDENNWNEQISPTFYASM